MLKKSFSSSKDNVKTNTNEIIKIKQAASQLTKGGSGHIPEYFVGIGTPVSFYA